MMYFFCFMGAGLFFLILAFTIALPTIILSPSKFALAFTLGCTSMMMAFASLKGWQQQLKHMFSSERLPFSAGEHGCSWGVGSMLRAAGHVWQACMPCHGCMHACMQSSSSARCCSMASDDQASCFSGHASLILVHMKRRCA
jgi:hypothetical protein